MGFKLKRPATSLLAGGLGVMGVLHFVAPKPFARIIPKALPAPDFLVAASGVAELAVAGGLLIPRTRRPAALAAAGLFVAVFPANVQMALDARQGPSWYKFGTYARLPLQAPMIAWALAIAKDAKKP